MPAPTSEDDLKRRARRRLIGAVALTLAAVIVLPLLLEDEPPPAGQLEVHMPPVVELPKAGNAPITPIAPPSAPTAPTGTASAAPPVSRLAGADKPAPPVASPQPESKKYPATNAPEKSVSNLASVDKPKPGPVEKFQPLIAKPAASGFVVQLGAFSHADKAVELKNRVENLGLASYTDRSGALTRLRVGPFSSREAAIEAAQRLSENGVQGQVMPK